MVGLSVLAAAPDQGLTVTGRGPWEPGIPTQASAPTEDGALTDPTGSAGQGITMNGKPARSHPWLAWLAKPRPAEATSRPADAWARHLSRLRSVELREAITDETLTPAEAEQLLDRLVLVIDQAITTTQ